MTHSVLTVHGASPPLAGPYAFFHPQTLAALGLDAAGHGCIHHLATGIKAWVRCMPCMAVPLDQIRVPSWLQQCWRSQEQQEQQQKGSEKWDTVSIIAPTAQTGSDGMSVVHKLILIPIQGESSKSMQNSLLASTDSTTLANLDVVNATSAMAKAANRRRSQTIAQSILQSLHSSLVQAGYVTEARVRGKSRAFKVLSVLLSESNIINLEEPGRVDLDTTIVEIQPAPPITDIAHSLQHIQSMPQADDLCKFIVDSFQHIEAYKHLSIPNNRAVIVTGVAGSGKSTLAHLACRKARIRVQELSLAKSLTEKEILESDQAAALSHIRVVFDKALVSAPCAVIIRDMDVLAKDRGVDGQLQTTVMSIICKELERVRMARDVVVIALTRNRSNLPEAFKRTELFQHEVQIPIPIRSQREDILKAYMPYETEADKDILVRVAQMTSGYVAIDLRNLCRSAQLHALRQQSIKSFSTNPLDDGVPSSLVTWENFEYAISTSRPSQQVEFDSMVRRHEWNAVGGYEDIKRRLYQSVHWPITHPETFKRMGVKPPMGLLLYGPSGCGKTMLVQALASKSNLNFIPIKGPEIYSKYLGETEATLRRLFAMARQIAPCILFFDEMDSIGARRGWNSDGGDGASNGIQERVLSTLLNEMDGVEERTGVFVIGCTNQPHAMDDALLRPGRLDQLIYVGYPDRRSRRGVIDAIGQKIPFETEESVRDELAKMTVGFSPADLSALFREAATLTLRQDMAAQEVQLEIIKECAKKMAPTVQLRVKTAFHRLSEAKDADPDMDVLVPELYSRFQQDRVQ